MRCAAATLADVKGLHPILGASYTDALIQNMIDSSLEFIFGNLGHAFGQAIRIWYEGAGTVITVEVTAAAVILTVDGTASTLTFADNELIADMVRAIEDLTDWEADVVLDSLLGQPSENLRVMAATTITANYENRLVICFEYRTECHFGRGESHVFIELPIHSITLVTEDGAALTAADHYWVDAKGWLIKKGGSGGTYYPYTVDVWSQEDPNNIVVKYVPRWYLVRPRVLLDAIAGLVLLKATSTGFKSERIGDYSYDKDGGGMAAFWVSTLGRYRKQWQPRGPWQPGMD